MLIDLVNREAEILLNNSTNPIFDNARMDNLKKVVTAIDEIYKNNDGEISLEEYDYIFKDLNAIVNKGILSPLSLRAEEFDRFGRNIRYPNIVKDDVGICNYEAFKGFVQHEYNADIKEEIVITNPVVLYAGNYVYITKGGVITGEYFDKCYIHPATIEKHRYSIQSIVNIPVSIINYKTDCSIESIWTMDVREPKFNILKQFYSVPIYKDENITHYDIRKFKKINNNYGNL